MKRILAACVLLMAGVLAGGWAAAQVNGSGGVYINGVLQGVGGGTGTVTSVGLTLPSFMNVSGTNPITTSGTFVFGLANVSAGALFAGPASGSDAAPNFRALLGSDLPIGLAFTDPTTNVAPTSTLLKSANAWPGATTNTTGANTIIAGGIGKRILTIVSYAHGSMAGSTVTLTIGRPEGIFTPVVTEGAAAEWLAATSNGATATSLAAAINYVGAGWVTAAASGADVRITPVAGTYSLTIAKTAADAGMTATSGADGHTYLPGMLDLGSKGYIVPGANYTPGSATFGAIGYYHSAYDDGAEMGGMVTVGTTVPDADGWIKPNGNFGANLILARGRVGLMYGGQIKWCPYSAFDFTDPNAGITSTGAGMIKITDGSTGWGSIAALSYKLFDGGTHYTTLQAQTQAADITWTLPPVANVSGALRNDGTGSLTWGHELLTDQMTWTFFDLATDLPATLDVPSIYVNRARAIHLTEVYCEIDAGSATINLTKNGANIATADITCAVTPSGTDGTTGILDNSGSHFVSTKDAIAVGDKIGHVMVTVGASLKRLNVVVKYTVD